MGQVLRRIWLLSQDMFVRAANLIAGHVTVYQPQVIVGIARGGLPLAQHVARRLGTEAVAIAARHNATDTAYLQATGRVDLIGPDVRLPPAGARLLVVDDICGTGATLTAVSALLTARCKPTSLRTAVLCRNAATDGGAYLPDVWVWRLRDWVVFPWEPLPPGRDEPAEVLAMPDHLSVKELQ